MKRPSEIIKAIEKDKKGLEFIPTGFKFLDDYLDGGLLKKELVVMGAYTGVGKSFMAGTMMYNIAQKGFSCAYYSLEISSTMIVSRLLGQLSNIKPTRITYGLLHPEEHNRISDAKAQLMVYDNFMYLSDDIYEFQKIKQSIRENSFDFVVIDFIQNIVEKGQEYERLSAIALGLQQLAKEKNCCLLVLSQLSNEAAKKGYMEYKGSGAIATVCDLGMFLSRETIEDGQEINEVKLVVKKNRRGFSGKELKYTFIQPGGAIQEWI